MKTLTERLLRLEGTVTIDVVPIGKPRITQRDKWAKRPCVLKYKAAADLVRYQTNHMKLNDVIKVSFVAYLPISKSWSKKKKAALSGQLHRLKPDIDNIEKFLLDALFKDDSGVAQMESEKRWDDGNGARIILNCK